MHLIRLFWILDIVHEKKSFNHEWLLLELCKYKTFFDWRVAL